MTGGNRLVGYDNDDDDDDNDDDDIMSNLLVNTYHTFAGLKWASIN